MMDSPLVSIITPSYNQGEFIERTILSVINQDYPDIEHIVMDGGSTDKTIDILKQYESSLLWISEADKGQSDAYNRGLLKSKGKIIGWLNSDDTFVPGAISKVVDFFDKNPDIGMVYGECTKVDDKDNVISRSQSEDFNLNRLINRKNFIQHPASFARRHVLEDIGMYDVNLHYSMDYDLWIRIGKRFKLKYFPHVLANNRKYPEAKSHALENRDKLMEEMLSVSRRHGGFRYSPLFFILHYKKLKRKFPVKTYIKKLLFR